MKSRRKRRIKGITESSNILNGLELVSMTYSYMGIFSRYVRGISAKISRKGWTDRQVATDWDINDVFNGSTTQEVNWHRHMTRVDGRIDYYNTNLKAEPLANKVRSDERNRSVVSAI